MTNQSHIKKALQRPYDLNLFAKEVLSPVFGSHFQMNINPVTASVELNMAERKVISKVLIYGKIDLEDFSEITFYEIYLHENSKIENSKVAIQRYVRKLLGNGQSALINFVNPANKNIWRFTYIANERAINEKGERESKIVNAKRYTYLLGTYESCKTAAERFEILSNETNLTMETLTKAFSVEKLSKSFFDEYLRHYDNFVAYLTNSNFKTSDFSSDDKAIRDFSKKLLGRIVFLYFVQKKGWLGATDLEYKDGLQNFMTEFYNLSGANDAFYNNFLKILFFETLNKSRKNDDFTMPDGTLLKIPFFNGGLFDKEKVDENVLTFKPELFHNVWDEENPKTRGFLDFLNAYNFTVYEDSPDEQTVAVDPEMLGHIFENLLEDNKDKGAYYTPKEIVHYMCQESLSEYLLTNYELGIRNYELKKDDLKESIRILVINKEISTLTKQELQEIDKLLDAVKICDPAIGSGAFPVGLLQEIFAIKELIAYETGTEWKPAAVKENIIQNSIYGVDIEKGAVDIARLRFWLSLVVDEEKPKALPNLDYKIVVGNSLVSKFEDEIIEIDWSNDTTKAGFYGQDIAQKRIDLLTDLTQKQKQFFHSENLDKKKCALEVRNLKIDILINQLELMIKTIGLETQPTYGKNIKAQTELYLKTVGWKQMVTNLKNIKNQAEKQLNYFDWQLDFPEILNTNVLKNNAGFDIIIGNPPYRAKMRDTEKKYCQSKFITAKTISGIQKGSSDTYTLFIDLGFNLCKINSNLHYIVPISITSSDSLTGVHKLIEDNCEKIIVSSYSVRPQPVFENAVVNTSILFFHKTLTKYKEIYSTKMYRKNKNFNLKYLVENLKFIEVSKYKIRGRYPKISEIIETKILEQLFLLKSNIGDYVKVSGSPIFYRTAGGRYFKVITNYSTGSNSEAFVNFNKRIANSIGAILSSNLFFWYYQIFSDNLSLKQFELFSFKFSNDLFSDDILNKLENLYSEYLIDIENNAKIRKVSKNSSYKVDTFKEYKIGKSKKIIDRIDDIICPIYGLTKEETEFIKNYEIEFRIRDDEEERKIEEI